MLNSTKHEISIVHIKGKMVKFFLPFKLSDVVFIMLINVKMPTIVLNIYEHDKFHAQLS